jgi:hypothetical protein
MAAETDAAAQERVGCVTSANNPNPDHIPNDGAPGQDTGSAAAEEQDDLLAKIQDWYKSDSEHRNSWIERAKGEFDMVANRQWDEDDQDALEDTGKVAITFNRIAPFIDAICGMEIQNRQEPRAIPRNLPAGGASDLATAALKWMRDECDADFEESAQFRDACICGEGWTDTRLDFDTDPDGMVDVSRVSPLDVFPDCSSRKANYADARRVMRIKRVPIAAARRMFPGVDDEDLDADWTNITAQRDPVAVPDNAFYRDGLMANDDKERTEVTFVEAQWWDQETSHRVQLQPGTKPVRVKPQQHEALQAAQRQMAMGDPTGMTPARLPSVKDKLRKYRKAIVGGIVLTQGDGPERGGFTLKAVTGKRDETKREWYGMARVMMDPQRYANKFFSEMLYIINTQSKGGIFAEEDAFENWSEAMNTYAAADAVTKVRPGALQNGKIQPKQQSQFPAAYAQMMEAAISAIPASVGFSAEMLGMVDRNQPGVLEMQRKQQGMAILADYFSAQRRYRREQGRLLFYYAQTFLSDSRLIRIGGSDNAKYLPLERDKLAGEYDIIIDDTPSSPNMKERVWGMLMQMLPILKDMGLPPQAMLELFKYSPFPDSLVAKIEQMVQQQMQQPHQQDPLTAAKAALDQARAQHLGVQAQHLAAEIPFVGAKVAADMDKKSADVALVKAQAMQALKMAAANSSDAMFQRDVQIIEQLLGAQDQAHGQAMDRAGLALDAQGQAHDQQIAQQQANTAATAAAQPSPSGA